MSGRRPVALSYTRSGICAGIFPGRSDRTPVIRPPDPAASQDCVRREIRRKRTGIGRTERVERANELRFPAMGIWITRLIDSACGNTCGGDGTLAGATIGSPATQLTDCGPFVHASFDEVLGFGNRCFPDHHIVADRIAGPWSSAAPSRRHTSPPTGLFAERWARRYLA